LKLHQERDSRRLEELEGLSAQQRSLRDALDAQRSAVAEAEDAKARWVDELQDAREEIERLKKHVADLESRKRAPLYQRKQEEELQV
jgi:predicted  nucleic acid-binding Zn-ribbon protein